MLTIDEARQRVAKGAAHLDQVRPGWFRQIDVGTLSLCDECRCIVGQLCGDFNEFSHLRALDLDTGNVVELGFNLHPREIFNHETGFPFTDAQRKTRWGYLQDAWIEAIAARLLPDTEVSSSDLRQTVTR